MVKRRYSVTGRVQGVGYRNWTQHRAQEHSLVGWVRNRSDGSVELLVSGDETTVSQFEKELWEGPTYADVKDVTELDLESSESGEDFQIRSTC